MGTIQELRPNGNVSGSSNFTAVGAGSLHGALSDEDLGSYVFRSTSGDKYAYFDCDAYTLGAGELVKRLRVGVTVEFDNKPLYYSWGCDSRQEPNVVTKTRQVKNTGKDTFYTSWVNANEAAPGSGVMNQADINSMQVWIRDKFSPLTNAWYEAWIELDIIDQPTVTVDSPSGVIAASRPAVEWTYADGDGDGQTHYETRVFTAAQYGAGGFDPETSDAFWQSGVVVSDVESVTVDTVLPNGVYRVYVRVAHDGGFQPYWSDWDFEGFTVTLTGTPSTPTVAAVQDYADTEVEVTVSGSALPGGLTTGTVRLQRSLDEETWEDVRLGYPQPSMSGSWSTVITDYEAPREVEVFYRAQVLGYDTANASWSPSSWSSTDSLTPLLDDSWWMAAWVAGELVETDGFSYLDGEWLLYAPRVSDQAIQEDSEPAEAIFHPLSREGAVVVTGALGLPAGSIEMLAHPYEYAALRALTDFTGPVLVRQPGIGQKWVSWVGPRSRTLEEDFRVVSVGYVGIDTPAVA